MPALGAALAHGVVSAGHVDAIARVAATLDDAVRSDLDACASGPGRRRSRVHRRRVPPARATARSDVVTRRRARAPRTVEAATGDPTLDGRRRALPHPHHVGPRERRPPLRRPGRRGRRREGQARRRLRPDVRPVEGRRLHGPRHVTTVRRARSSGRDARSSIDEQTISHGNTTSDASARPATATRCRSPRSAGWPARPTSSPRC